MPDAPISDIQHFQAKHIDTTIGSVLSKCVTILRFDTDHDTVGGS